MTFLQLAILEIVKANDGRFSWYQIDRALTQRAGGFDPGIVSKDLMPALRELEEGGYIITRTGHNPARPLYSIRDEGERELEARRN
jgi:DNA-binding PadR family transcriptional regulator